MVKPHAFSGPIYRYLASFMPVYGPKAEIKAISPSNPHGYYEGDKWVIMGHSGPFSRYRIINPVYEAT